MQMLSADYLIKQLQAAVPGGYIQGRREKAALAEFLHNSSI